MENTPPPSPHDYEDDFPSASKKAKLQDDGTMMKNHDENNAEEQVNEGNKGVGANFPSTSQGLFRNANSHSVKFYQHHHGFPLIHEEDPRPFQPILPPFRDIPGSLQDFRECYKIEEENEYIDVVTIDDDDNEVLLPEALRYDEDVVANIPELEVDNLDEELPEEANLENTGKHNLE